MDDVLVFGLRTPQVARRAADRLNAGRPARGAIGEIERYVAEHRPDASLSLLHPALSTIINEGEQWELGFPMNDAPGARDLAAIYVLHLASAEHAPRLENVLRSDSAGIAYVHHPAVRYPLAAQRPCLRRGRVGADWGIHMCRFPEVWAKLDTGGPAGAIGIIDQGRDEGHPELTGRITKQEPLLGASKSLHAGAVAGIISAIRNGQGAEALKGCCSAELHLYNVWTMEEKFDPCAYYRALHSVTDPRLPVVNLSIGGATPDPTEELHVRACLASDVVLVAAIGNLGDDGLPAFPARYDGVVAVGATTPSDGRVTSSTRDDHMWICAPGERIWTIEGPGQYDSRTGTSFAAPFVTAAVWLARMRKPCLTVDEIRQLLQKSVAPCTVPAGGRSPDFGYGRLDMVELMRELDQMRECA